MRIEFDDFDFKDEIELINIEKQMQQNQAINNQTLGFNSDNLYNEIENNNL